MINLDNLTLVCVDGRNNIEILNKCTNAIIYSCSEIKFKEILFFCPEITDQKLLNKIKEYNIKLCKISNLSLNEYNKFIIQELHNFIKTEFCLLIQWDGFVLNPNLWSNDFFDYDYIGASWKEYHIEYSGYVNDEIKKNKNYSLVGNGGFSLRSKKLLYETSICPVICNEPEDSYICISNYEYFINKGIKFAPTNVADKFSRESNQEISWDSVFGFHDKEKIKELC
jgi:hypothetical protein